MAVSVYIEKTKLITDYGEQLKTRLSLLRD